LAHCSPLAADLVARLLEKEPTRRMTATQALGHPWINIQEAAAAAAADAGVNEEEVRAGCCGMCLGSGGGKLFKDPSYHDRDYSSSAMVDSTAHSIYRGTGTALPRRSGDAASLSGHGLRSRRSGDAAGGFQPLPTMVCVERGRDWQAD
jgi:serine/threonine protein kinase